LSEIMRNLLTKPAAVLVAVVATGMAAGVAWATIPDGGGTIHACYSPSDKSLRVVDSGGCNKSETGLNWSASAIQGLPGPQGPSGVQGDTGPAGLPGVTVATTVDFDEPEDPVIGGFFKELTCPSGTKALQGRYEWQSKIGNNLPQNEMESFPTSDESWGFAVGANSTYKVERAFLYLTCINAN
jgi:hypothetical protein